MSPADHELPPQPELSPESERALAALGRDLDGEPVGAPELEAARGRLAEDPELARAWETTLRVHAALAAVPAVAASPGFADRVVAAARREPAPILPFVRRLVAAASITLGVTVGWGAARPMMLAADASVEQAWHAVDHFRASPYAGDDLAAGIRSLLRAPDPTAPPVRPAGADSSAGSGADAGPAVDGEDGR